MLNKIDTSRSSEGWEDSSKADSTKRRSTQNDTYRKVEGDKHRPPSKNEQEQSTVGEKKDSRSVFDLSRKTPPKKGMVKESGKQEKAEPEGALQRASPKKGDQESGVAGEGKEDEFASAETEGTEKPAAFGQPKEPETDPSKKLLQPLANVNVKQPAPDLMGSQAAAHLKTAKPDLKESAGDVKGEGQTGKKEKTKDSRSTTAPSSEGLDKVNAGAAQPPIQGVGFGTDKAEQTQDTAKSATIKDIATQIVDRIQVMRKEDQTSTIITLKSPPELAGSTITLTASDHAKREFNVTFANLSPEGKMLLDRRLKEDSLIETLDRKGIIVHNVITTTQPEKIIQTDAGQAAQDQRQQRDEQQDQQQKRQRAQEYEEEEQA